MAYVDNFKTTNAPSASSNDDDVRKIFVGGLSWRTTEEDLKEYFTEYGAILDCVLKVDMASGRSRGFGFVLFKDTNSVERVLMKSELILDGRRITPRRARKGREPVLKVFVGGVDPALPDRDIWDYFGQFGKVVDLDLPYDRNKGCRRAFCFVTFDTEDGVSKVCRQEKHTLGEKFVDVKRATPKNSRNDAGAVGFYPRGNYNGTGTGYVPYGAGRGSGYGSGGSSGFSTSGNYVQSYNNGGYNSGNTYNAGNGAGYGSGNGGGYGSGNAGGYAGNGSGYAMNYNRMTSRGASNGGTRQGSSSGYGGSSRAYSQGSGDWGRQQSGGQNYSGGYNNSYYNKNYDGYE